METFEEAKKVIDIFNEVCSTDHKYVMRNLKKINVVLSHGHSLKTIKEVTNFKREELAKENRRINPSTLFRDSAFDRYYNDFLNSLKNNQ